MRVGAVVLAGGRSSRMGAAKAGLDWHGSSLLRRVCGIVDRAVDGPVVVVGAPGQDLPDPGAGVEVVRDEREGRGPLGGLAAGLAAVEGRAQAAYVSSTDVPFLHPAFVRAVVTVLAARPDADVALPVAGGYVQPLAAAYRTSLAALVHELVAADRLKPALLFASCNVVRVQERELSADAAVAVADPRLESLVNLNTPAEYAAARALPAPRVAVEGSGTVEAATLGAAASIVRVELDSAAVTLNGAPVPPDPSLPLVAGDAVAFRPKGA